MHFDHDTSQIVMHDLQYGCDTIIFPWPQQWEWESVMAMCVETCDQEYRTLVITTISIIIYFNLDSDMYLYVLEVLDIDVNIHQCL